MDEVNKGEEVAVRIISKLSRLIMGMQEAGAAVPQFPALDVDDWEVVAGAVLIFPFDEEAK